MNPHLGASAKAINNAAADADASRKNLRWADGRTNGRPFYLQFSRGQGPKSPSLRAPKMVGEKCTDASEEQLGVKVRTFSSSLLAVLSNFQRGWNLQPVVAANL